MKLRVVLLGVVLAAGSMALAGEISVFKGKQILGRKVADSPDVASEQEIEVKRVSSDPLVFRVVDRSHKVVCYGLGSGGALSCVPAHE